MPIRPRTPVRSAQSGLWRHWSLWVWFVLALVLSVGGVALWKSGRWLIKDDPVEKVRWAVVLAGESRDCERSDAAIRLFQDGRADSLILSGTRIFKTRYQSEFLVDYFVQQGVPRDRLFEFRHDAYSTQEEARLLVRQFRLMNLDTVLIVTTTFHTARTRRIFRKLAGGNPVVLVAAAEYHVYDPNAWWSNRESRKLWFSEWAKTVFTWFEMSGIPPEMGKAEFQGLTPDIWSTGEGPRPVIPPVDSLSNRPRPDSAAGPEAKTADPDGDAKGAKDSTGKEAEASKSGEKAAGDAGAAEKQIGEKVSEKGAADSAKARKDSLKAAAAVQKAAKDSAAEAAAAKSVEAAKFAAEATRTAQEGKAETKAAKDTVVKKMIPRAPKKPAGPAPKTPPKKEEKKPEKAEKTKKKG